VKSKVAQEDGQGLVEFVLVVPFLLILILGVIDLGKALGYKNDMTSLASQAARIAAVNSCSGCPASGPDRLSTYIKSIAPSELKNGGTDSIPTPISITYSFPNNTNTPPTSGCKGDPVKVTISTDYHWLGFLTGKTAVPGSAVAIASSATMRLETNYDPTSLTNLYTPASPPTPPAGGCPS